MKITVRAKPSAKTTFVEKIDEKTFIISVVEPSRENKANFAIIKALAEYFNTSFSRIRLVSGRTAKQKTFEIT
ncbi:MAG: DUF167 domain-containing protein [Patescibacteria group bacterium]|nr:DUF167 domain-containing protein [Patescibacteria group bacterium]